MSQMPPRIFLSPPDVGQLEQEFVAEAFRTNWIAPIGPHVDAFEKEFATLVGATHAVALSSGTAGIHLALRLLGVGPGDEVFCSSLTFIASASPILYQGATPVFLDSDEATWNLDPNVLADALKERAAAGRLPKALVAVDLYGQCADLDPISELCNRHGVALVEDAAEALGATYKGRHAGSYGQCGIFSFNGNKIITTSGGGMLVTEDGAFAQKARFLATQARDPAPHYEHSTVGYNYRLSNVLAGIGRGQIRSLERRVERRRANFDYYKKHLGHLPYLHFMPEAPFGRATRWLTCFTLDANSPRTPEQLRVALEKENIESRPVWKPLHLQPALRQYPMYGGSVSERLFTHGLCVPSGSNLTDADLERVVGILRRELGA